MEMAKAFNRTKLELKQTQVNFYLNSIITFNRTKLELKLLINKKLN